MSTGYEFGSRFDPFLWTYTWTIVVSTPSKAQLLWEPPSPLLPIIEPETPAPHVTDANPVSPTLIHKISSPPKKIVYDDHSSLKKVAKFFCSENTHIIETISDMQRKCFKAYSVGRNQDVPGILVAGYIVFWKALSRCVGYNIWKFVKNEILMVRKSSH